MSRVALALAIIAATLTAVAEPEPAEACSLAPAVQLEDPYSGLQLEGVPVSGPLALLAYNSLEYATPEDLEAVAFTVREAGGAELAGTTEITDTRVLWRPDAPLDPLSTYTATLELGWFGGPAELSFTTADAEASSTPVADPEQIALREERRTVAQTCCELEFADSCGNQLECGASEAAIHPVLRLAFASPGLRRYQDLSVTAAGVVEPTYYNMGFPIRFAAGDAYCAQVTATSIIDGAQVTAEVCADPANLVPLESEFTPFECDGPEVDPDTGEPTDASAGCSTTGSSGSAALLLIALAMARLRRRRRC
jgi:MYXO-CTERM domain-containing protein